MHKINRTKDNAGKLSFTNDFGSMFFFKGMQVIETKVVSLKLGKVKSA